MSIVLRAAVTGGLAALAMAATVTAAQEHLPEITVQGQRDVFESNEGKLVTLTRQVRYADLNLATPSGAEALQRRIKDTAEAVCRQLLERYPAEASGGFLHTNENCAKDATANAMQQVNEAIAAAKGKGAGASPPVGDG